MMRKIIIPMFLITMIFSLSSCQGGEGTISITDPKTTEPEQPNDTSSTENNGSTNNNDNSSLQEPDYKNPSINITDSSESSPSTVVEQTVEKVYDSVVSINVIATTFTASGSGVLFAEDETLGLSYIVTCFHVIEDAYKFDVTLTNGEVYTASLVGGYSSSDLAVLSIEETNLTYASFYEDSDALKLGSQVVCIGNPLGILPGSISSGYLSYINRVVSVDTYTKMELLQTDVAINSGNSGGGLFNTSGVLIGIVNAKYSSSGIEGLGFAIPMNTVREVIYSIFSTAKYDAANKLWDEGYVVGDWEFGFTISDGRYSSGGFGNAVYVIYISDLSSNMTMSGASSFQLKDIITNVRVDYKDESKTDFDITSLSSASDALATLYSSNLSLEDTLIFTISRNNVTQTINVEIVQYVYSV